METYLFFGDCNMCSALEQDVLFAGITKFTPTKLFKWYVGRGKLKQQPQKLKDTLNHTVAQ